MGWNGMGWDGMGWDEMRMRRRKRRRRRSGKSLYTLTPDRPPPAANYLSSRILLGLKAFKGLKAFRSKGLKAFTPKCL